MSVVESFKPAPSTGAPSPSTPSYRADIDGLRAISILLVVTFHSRTGPFSGGFVGVDVFFVISGFLITGLLFREACARGTISLAGFYARRIRRLLPLSVLVLVSTVIVGFVLLPPIDHAALLADARSAALYIANWRFAGQATAYSDTGPSDSLFVHYWSLSIEEQFYLLWPLLILVVTNLLARRGRSLRPALLGVMAGLTMISLSLSIILTRSQGSAAYYATHLRIGELAVGAGIALALPWVRHMPRRTANVSGALGMAGIVAAAVLFRASMPYPGSAVILPVVGSALVLASGTAHPTWVSRVLSLRPLPALGRVSYGWYLWHWPAFGVAQLLLPEDASSQTTTLATAAALTTSLGLAILSYHLVEQPVRRSRRLVASPRASLATGLALTLFAVGAITLPGRLMRDAPAEAAAADGGVVAAVGGFSLAMTPQQARADRVRGMDGCHVGVASTTVRDGCVFGARDGARTIALIGDSHAQHWFPVLEELARQQGWRLLAWTKSACPVIDVPIYYGKLKREYTECAEWRRNLIRTLASHQRIDLIVVGRIAGYKELVLDASGDRLPESGVEEAWAAGATRTFAHFVRVAEKVLVLEETPSATFDVPSCLSGSPQDPSACAFPSTGRVDRDAILVAAERAVAPPGVAFGDLTDALCPSDPCPVVTRDGLIIYRDSNHMTTAFSLTLIGVLQGLLTPLVAG